MESFRQTSHAPRLAFLLLVSFFVCDARTRPTYDAPASTPPQFGAIAPPVSSVYGQHPNYWRRDLPDEYYQAYHPVAAYTRRRPYFHEYLTPPYGSHSMRGPPAYDPYLDRAYRRDNGDPYTAFARPWRYHNPYLQTRYFEDIRRPSWHRPSYSYLQSYVSLPYRFFYPHFSQGGGDAPDAAMPERRPTFQQYLVFIPLRDVMNSPALLGPTMIGGDVGPVYQPGKPEVGVEDGAGMVSVGDQAAPDDGDLNQSHGGALESQSIAEENPPETTSINPSTAEDKVVGQSEEGETSTKAWETTPAEEMDALTSTDKPEQSAGEMEAVTSPPQGVQPSEENGGEGVTESETSTEEEPEHVYPTEPPETDSVPDEEAEPFVQSEKVTEESVEGDDSYQGTTTPEPEDGDHESDPDTTTSTPTTKAVFVQLHLLEQHGKSTTATPSTTRPSKRGDKTAASESSLIFLGMNMPREQPEDTDSQRDRIHKRYSDTKAHVQLSLDFKTAHERPAIV